MAAAPISFVPSQVCDGNDGSWSSFSVQIGKPAQTFRVLPSTSSQDTWVPLLGGCPDDSTDCMHGRGAFTRLFSPNESSSWKELGIYDLHLGQDLGYVGNGYFGLDTVGLQIPKSGGVELPKRVVAGITTVDFHLGLFGLDPKPLNFSNFENPILSFLQTLRDQELIPSLSYGYTAGASYRSPPVFGSLTIGGYDESRFMQKDTQYPFDVDDSRPLSLFIESITTSDSVLGRATLLDQKAYTKIDSTFPHLWLPREVCDRFEQAFHLSSDQNTDLYLVNSTTRQTLLDMNATITIGLGLTMEAAKKTNIIIPYKAFDLQASSPIYSNATYYFPIRRAANESQHRLGRTFLQEAYIIVDHDRAKFSVHQATHQSPAQPEKIIPIIAPKPPPKENNGTIGNRQQTNHSLSHREIAGISIGSFAFILLSVIFFMILRRLRKGSDPSVTITGEDDVRANPGLVELDREELKPPELHSYPVHEMYEPPSEMYHPPTEMEAQSNLSASVEDGSNVTEMDG